MLIGFSFGAFLEGAAGGGTPVAICGAIMVGLGFDPFLAAVLCLIANTSPVAYGGLGTPRIAVLSAVETITPKIPSTIEAAALCKMAERGQITGGILDGPLAFDNAVDPEAAAIKGIKSAVAGRAQILVVPDLEAGNILAKQLTFLLGADAAGIVLGTRVPIILTSRADSVRARLASCAVGMLLAHARRTGAVSATGGGA